MRVFSILTAILVVAVLYFVVLERDALEEFAGAGSAAASDTETPAEDNETAASRPRRRRGFRRGPAGLEARIVDSAVILRGRTQAARQVELRAETSGLIINEPLRRGASVSEGRSSLPPRLRAPARLPSTRPTPVCARRVRACPRPKRNWPKRQGGAGRSRNQRPRSLAPVRRKASPRKPAWPRPRLSSKRPAPRCSIGYRRCGNRQVGYPGRRNRRRRRPERIGQP